MRATIAPTTTTMTTRLGASMLPRRRVVRCASQSSRQELFDGPRLFSTSRNRATASSSSSSSHNHNPFPFPGHLPNPTPYDILHLSRNATQAEIKGRYYELVKWLHPDRQRALSLQGADDEYKGKGRTEEGEEDMDSSSSTAVAEEFRQVVKAYELLSHSKKRHAFDRYGYGWDGGTTSNANGYGTYGSANRWEWSELQRRQRASFGNYHAWMNAHDQKGWQQTSDEEFFFSRHSSDHHQRHDGSPRYSPNSHFIACIAMVTWTLAIWQINRLTGQAAQASVAADKRHLDAVSSYQEAKDLANSKEGRKRFESLRARAREGRILDQVEAQKLAALQARSQQGRAQPVTPSHYLPPPPPAS